MESVWIWNDPSIDQMFNREKNCKINVGFLFHLPDWSLSFLHPPFDIFILYIILLFRISCYFWQIIPPLKKKGIVGSNYSENCYTETSNSRMESILTHWVLLTQYHPWKSRYRFNLNWLNWLSEILLSSRQNNENVGHDLANNALVLDLP